MYERPSFRGRSQAAVSTSTAESQSSVPPERAATSCSPVERVVLHRVSGLGHRMSCSQVVDRTIDNTHVRSKLTVHVDAVHIRRPVNCNVLHPTALATPPETAVQETSYDYRRSSFAPFDRCDCQLTMALQIATYSSGLLLLPLIIPRAHREKRLPLLRLYALKSHHCDSRSTALPQKYARKVGTSQVGASANAAPSSLATCGEHELLRLSLYIAPL